MASEYRYSFKSNLNLDVCLKRLFKIVLCEIKKSLHKEHLDVNETTQLMIEVYF